MAVIQGLLEGWQNTRAVSAGALGHQSMSMYAAIRKVKPIQLGWSQHQKSPNSKQTLGINGN